MNITSYVLVVFVSQTTPAEHAETTAVASPPATWSIGAGAGLGGDMIPAPSYTGGFYGPTPLWTVVPRVGFERILSSRLALGFGLVGSFERSSSEFLNTQRANIGLVLGPRWQLTPSNSPVDVSLYAGAMLGYAHVQGTGAIYYPRNSYSFSAGAVGGLVVERKIMERIAVRFNAQLISASMAYSRDRYSENIRGLGELGSPQPSTTTLKSTVTGQVNVVPSPSLELRLYF